MDRTVEIAKSFGVQIFVEEWKGYAAEKNSAIAKSTGDWILILDADESLETGVASAVHLIMSKPHGLTETELQSLALAKGGDSLETAELAMAFEEAFDVEGSHSISGKRAEDIPLALSGYWFPRKNFFLGRWIKHGGFWPDPKLRLIRRGYVRFEERAVHETLKGVGYTARLKSGSLLHHSYPTLSDYIDHMNRYSSLGAQMSVVK